MVICFLYNNDQKVYRVPRKHDKDFRLKFFHAQVRFRLSTEKKECIYKNSITGYALKDDDCVKSVPTEGNYFNSQE